MIKWQYRARNCKEIKQKCCFYLFHCKATVEQATKTCNLFCHFAAERVYPTTSKPVLQCLLKTRTTLCSLQQVFATCNSLICLDHYTFLGNCPPTPPLSQRINSWVVTRARLLFNTFSSNVAKQGARFCGPFHWKLKVYSKKKPRCAYFIL